MYKLVKNGVIRLVDDVFIPNEPANKDWQEYQRWLNQGSQPIPENIPNECIDRQTYQIDENCVFTKLKNKLIFQLNQITQQYIETYYPDVKQKSDISDKEYWGAWLIEHNSNYNIDLIYKYTSKSAQNIWQGLSDLQTELNNHPSDEQIAWEQLIKIAVRVGFVQACKNKYHQIRIQIENANSIDELRQIDLSQIDFPKMPI